MPEQRLPSGLIVPSNADITVTITVDLTTKQSQLTIEAKKPTSINQVEIANLLIGHGHTMLNSILEQSKKALSNPKPEVSN